MKTYYLDEVKNVSKNISQYKDCFKFAILADSHLDNSVLDTLLNIQAVDENVDFNCLVHLGDFLNGNLPRHYTQSILKNQMDGFRKCINGKPFYPVQGNHDGFSDVRATRVYPSDIAFDEDWYEATSFVDSYENVGREKTKPYFYVDYPKEKVRMVVLCTFYYNEGADSETYDKQYGIDLKQIDWMKNVAFNVDKDWTVMVFSHDLPFINLNKGICSDNERINGFLAIDIINEARKRNGFSFAGWFIGHTHGDCICNVEGLNFILVGSETAYVPQLWNMPIGGYYSDRELNTVSEDLWDGVILDKAERKIRLFRFGAGNDRKIDY